MFQKILLAQDGSDHANKAAEYAVELAKKFNGSIDMVYVVDGNKAKSDVLHSADQYEIKKKREEKMAKAKEMAQVENIPCRTHILHGDPGPVVVEFANEHDYDCVVVGSRGLNPLKTIFVGSVSRKIAQQAECPVLIVK